jgi:hypothetical protein
MEERRLECLLLSNVKIQKLVRKTRRNIGRNAEFYVIDVSPTAKQLAEFHTEEELTAEQRDNCQSSLCGDFPELLQSVHSSHVSRLWDRPIENIGPMKCHRLNILSPDAERAELHRQLEDAMKVVLTRPSHSESGLPILFMRKTDGSLRLCIDYRGLNEVTRYDAYPLPRVDDTLDELKDANFYTHLDLAYGLW